MYLRSLQLAREGAMREVEGAPTGGNPAPAAVVPAAPAAPRGSVPEVYSSDFVRGVMAERDALKSAAAKAADDAKAAAEKASTEAREASEKAVREAEERVTKASKALSDRLVRAEVKATGLAAGIAHLDFLKLVDTSEVKVGEDGEVSVPEGFWAAVKSKLPHLFSATGADKGTTTNPAAPPKPAPTGTKKAADMTPAEFKAAMGRIAAGQAP